MSSTAKVHKEPGGDRLSIESGGSILVKTGGKLLPNSGTQPTHIADLPAISGGEAPTEAEHNAHRAALNGVLAILRGLGAVASS